MTTHTRYGAEIHRAQTPLGTIEYALVGTGKPVLILHGSPGGIDQAELMARFLPPEQTQAVLVSRPGYLGTDLGHCRTVDEQAVLFIALLDELGIERAGVLGWSGAGPAAYRLGARFPDRISALVTIAALSKAYVVPKTDLSMRLMFGTRVGEWLVRVLAAHQPKQIVTGTLSNEGDLTKEELSQLVEEVFADNVKRQFLLDLATTVGMGADRKDGWENDCAQFATLGPLGLESIGQPCLIVLGTADNDVTPDHSREAAAAIPNAELLELPRGTHMAFYTHSDAHIAQARAVALLTR